MYWFRVLGFTVGVQGSRLGFANSRFRPCPVTFRTQNGLGFRIRAWLQTALLEIAWEFGLTT